MDKKTHFGRAGEFFAMSELLLRGWNVAVPVVDIGDDVFVIDDNDKTTWRLQVKTATAEQIGTGDAAGGWSATFSLSRTQLRTPQPIELIFMFVVRVDERWRFLVIPRTRLAPVREVYVNTPKVGPGRRPVADDAAIGDALRLEVRYDAPAPAPSVTGWDASLVDYVDRWPAELPIVATGPGAVKAEQAEPSGGGRQ